MSKSGSAARDSGIVRPRETALVSLRIRSSTVSLEDVPEVQRNDSGWETRRPASVEWVAPPEEWLENAAVALEAAVEECCRFAPPGLEHDPVVVRVCCVRESEIHGDRATVFFKSVISARRHHHHLVCKPAVHAVSAKPMLATKSGRWLESKGLYMVACFSLSFLYLFLAAMGIFTRSKSMTHRIVAGLLTGIVQLGMAFLGAHRCSYSIWKLCLKSTETTIMIVFAILSEVLLRSEKVARLSLKGKINTLLAVLEVENAIGNAVIQCMAITSDALLVPHRHKKILLLIALLGNFCMWVHNQSSMCTHWVIKGPFQNRCGGTESRGGLQSLYSSIQFGLTIFNFKTLLSYLAGYKFARIKSHVTNFLSPVWEELGFLQALHLDEVEIRNRAATMAAIQMSSASHPRSTVATTESNLVDDSHHLPLNWFL